MAHIRCFRCFMKQVKQLVNQPEVQASIAYLPDFAIGRQLREGVLVNVKPEADRQQAVNRV